MKVKVFILIAVEISSGGGALSQTFSCKTTSSAGISISGTNPHDRVVRCVIDCGYLTNAGLEQHQRCNPAMQPNSFNITYCAFNLNNAKTVIGVSQSCH